MTKPEFVKELAETFELPRKQVALILETMLEKMTAVLKDGGKVQLTPFGQFKVRDRAARIARNPQTGEPVKVPAKRVLKFIAARALKEAVGTAKRGTSVKKAAVKKAVVKKAAIAKAPVKKAVAKKAAVKKAVVKKAVVKKAAPKKAVKASRKVTFTPRKAKPVARKAAPRKAAAKR